MRTDVPKELLHGKRARSSVLPPVPFSVVLASRLSMRLLTFRLSMSSKPRYLREMVNGAVAVWFPWFLLTIMAARFLLPVLVVVLWLVSASPTTDLLLVALSFILATVAGAVAGLVTSVVRERHSQFQRALSYVSLLAVAPYATLIGLIARAEHGLLVAPAVVAGLAARPYLWRLVRRAWAAGALRAQSTVP
jgi:hypothetical protein